MAVFLNLTEEPLAKRVARVNPGRVIRLESQRDPIRRPGARPAVQQVARKMLIWLNVAGLVVAIGIVGLAFSLGIEPHSAETWWLRGPPCLISKLLDIPSCPSCGLTRGFSLAVRGDLRGASAINPWSLPLLASTLLVVLASAISLVLGSARPWCPVALVLGVEGLGYLLYSLLGLARILSGS